MFINIKTITSVVKDPLDRPVSTIEKKVYLMDGQIPTEKVQHPNTQAFYKKVYLKCEELSIKYGRPVTVFEAMDALKNENPSESIY